jgi:hypothetical protein
MSNESNQPCNCIRDIEKHFNEKGLEGAFIDTSLNFVTGEVKPSGMQIKYTQTTSSGKKVNKKMPLIPSYCPFCGKEYRKNVSIQTGDLS